MPYSYNNETDFLEWYKANYKTEFAEGSTFTRPEGMDDNTWAAVSELYRGYLDSLNKDSEIDSINKKYNESTNSILQRYSSAQNTLDENKRLAQQNASITYDKLKKYLPSQIKAQGLSGLGASESAMLHADSNYMNSMGDIASNYSKDVTDLSNSKNEAIANLEKYKNDDLSKIDDKYAGYLRDASDKAFEAYRTGVETDFTNAYNAALTDINSRTDVDEATMEQYINDAYSGKVRDSDLQLLIAAGKARVADNVKIAEEKAAGEKELAYEYVVVPELDRLDTNGEWEKALAYLEKNKGYFTNQSEYEAKRSYYIEKALADYEEEGSWSKILSLMEQNKTYFGDQKYEKTVSEYKKAVEDIKVSGLSTGGAGDDIDITFDGKTYDLRISYKNTDDIDTLYMLNEETTGDKLKYPKRKTLRIYQGKLYICTGNAWAKVVGDRDKVSPLIEQLSNYQ